MIGALMLCKIGKGYAGYFGMQGIVHGAKDEEQTKNSREGGFFCYLITFMNRAERKESKKY